MNRCRIFTDDDYQLLLTQHLRRDKWIPFPPIKWQWRIIFRLSACCGLRSMEIRRLTLADVMLDERPAYLRVYGKGDKWRSVWLSWVPESQTDFRNWVTFRKNQGAGPSDPFVCNQGTSYPTFGYPLHERALFDKFVRFCKPLGRKVSIHDGRHSAATHALAKGKSLVAVRDWLGHSSLTTTTIYLHVLDDFREDGSDLFAVARELERVSD